MEKQVVRNMGIYSQAIRIGELVFVTGQVGAGDEFVTGSISDQTAHALQSLESILKEAGSSLNKLVRTTVMLVDLADYDAMDEVYGRLVGEPRPARTTFAVAGLPTGALIKIEAIAHT